MQLNEEKVHFCTQVVSLAINAERKATTMHPGELIRVQRKRKGMTQKQLAEAVGVSTPSIRLYELGKRTPSEEMLCQIADALEISPEALHPYNVASAREVLEMLFRMESDYGIEPTTFGQVTQISIDPTAPHAPKLIQALNVWSEMRQKRDATEITQEEYDAWKASFGR